MDPIKKTGVHKIKIKTLMILLLFLSGIALIPPGYAEDWILEERGDSYEIFYNSANPNQKRWNSAPMWVYSGTEYLPYIYSRDEAKKCYTVQSGLIGFELYDTGIAKFYDPQLLEERVKSEIWEIWYLDGSVWKEASLDSSITFTVHQYTDSIIIEATRFSYKPDGALLIRYIFVQGQPLKHEITWQSLSTETEIVEVRQVWDLKLSTDKVVTDSENLLTISTITNSTTYLFGDSENDFLVRESQWSATYYPDGTLRENGFIEADIDFSGKKVTYKFGNWTLEQGETLEIDPDTSTFYPGDGDDDAYELEDPQAVYDDQNDVVVISDVAAWARYHGGVRFANVAIPRGSSISAAKVSCYISSDTYDDANLVIYGHDTAASQDFSASPYISHAGLRVRTTASASWVADSIGEGYKDKTGLEAIVEEIVALGTWDSGDALTLLFIANSDSSKDFRFSAIEDLGGARKPKLYVEYTLGEIQVQYYTVTDSRVNIDANVNIDVQLNYTSDYAPVIDGTVTVNGISASHQGTGTWRITQSKSSVQGVNYNTVAASGNSRGCSSVDQNGQSQLVIWDRFIVTSIWVSQETLIVGQTVYLYVTGYLEYDSHASHYDDSLVIEGISFSYDWENTRWYATDSRETTGENVYDTLTSCEEDTYNIIVGTMDGKSASATWVDSQYDFYGPYYENGSNADPMNITLIVNGISETIELDGNYTKYTAGTASLALWSLPEGGTRYYQINSNNETIYIFIPEATYSTYTFTIYCYSAGIPGYLESNRYVNGTRRMVERKLISAEQNQIPMLMIVGEAYFMSYDAKDGLQYDLGIFVPGSLNPTYTITRSGITSAEKSVYRWIKVTSSRSSDNTQIEVNYKDELDNTTWLDIEILYLNGTTAYESNITDPNPAVQFQYNNADNETEYLGVLEIEHGSLGDYTHRMTFPLYKSFSRPFDLGFLGSIGLYGFFISDLISIGAIIGVATVFSTKEAVLGAFTITILTFAFIALGWVDWGYGMPILAFLIVILMGINEARKDR